MRISFHSAWYESKGWFQDTLGITGEQAHVHFGLAVFLIVAVLFFRRKHGILIAWLTVFILQCVNEALDARDWLRWTETVNWSETVADFAATLFWPSILYLLWRKFCVSANNRGE